MQKVISNVWQTIRKQRLFSAGDTIILGVSGGADSVSLAIILSRINRYYKQNWSLVIAHLNHQIRGKAARQDEAFVHRLAGRLNIPFYRKERNIPALSKLHKLSLEETARIERYRFFEEVARRHKPLHRTKVAVGHTLDDNAETVLFRIIRGTGLRGLKGIVPIRELFHNSPIRLTRPLIELGHQELVDFLKQEKINYRLDKTNLDKAIMRNRIRHELLPMLATYNKQIKQHLVNLSETAGQFDDYLKAVMAKRFNKRMPRISAGLAAALPRSISITTFKKEHPLIQVALLNEIISRRRKDKQIGYVHYQDILNLIGKSGDKGIKELHLPANIRVRRKAGQLLFSRR